jgi:hypothetical protein
MTDDSQPNPPGEQPQEPYEPPQAEDLEVAEGTVVTVSGAAGTPPSDEQTDFEDAITR